MTALVPLIVLLVVVGREPSSVQPVRIDGASSGPKVLKRVRPMYPEAAWHVGLEGDVVVECAVGADGRVTSAKILEGDPPLASAALAAVRKWRYSPTLLDGRPIEVTTTVTVSFRHPRVFYIRELKAALEHKHEFIREAAAFALGRLGPKAVDATLALMRATQDESERVRNAASAALARVRGKRP